MENFSKQESCCPKKDSKTEKKGILADFAYGILPHTFCIAFIIFSVIGSVTAITFFKKFLLNPYFFHILNSSFISFYYNLIRNGNGNYASIFNSRY